MRTRTLCLVPLLVAATAAAALAQPTATNPVSLPGFVDARQLGIERADEELAVEVNLQGALIRFVAEAARGTEPELSDALSKIESFRFRLFRLPPAEVAEVRRRVERAASSLAGRGWEGVVRIREGNEQSHLLLKMDGERIIGLTVLFVDDEDQMGFINLAGEIDPAQIGRIGRRFDIDLLKEAQIERP